MAPILEHPTPDSIADAKAAQQAERLAAGLCVECGRPREAHYDTSGVFLIGCPRRDA